MTPQEQIAYLRRDVNWSGNGAHIDAVKAVCDLAERALAEERSFVTVATFEAMVADVKAYVARFTLTDDEAEAVRRCIDDDWIDEPATIMSVLRRLLPDERVEFSSGDSPNREAGSIAEQPDHDPGRSDSASPDGVIVWLTDDETEAVRRRLNPDAMWTPADAGALDALLRRLLPAPERVEPPDGSLAVRMGGEWRPISWTVNPATGEIGEVT